MDRDDLVLLHRARDQMDREYARPLDGELLARTACMSSGHFSRSFRAAYGRDLAFRNPAGNMIRIIQAGE